MPSSQQHKQLEEITASDLRQSIMSDDAVSTQNFFNDLMLSKVADEIAGRRQELSAQMFNFNSPEEETSEENDGTDEEFNDDEDLDLTDVELDNSEEETEDGEEA